MMSMSHSLKRFLSNVIFIYLHFIAKKLVTELYLAKGKADNVVFILGALCVDQYQGSGTTKEGDHRNQNHTSSLSTLIIPVCICSSVPLSDEMYLDLIQNGNSYCSCASTTMHTTVVVTRRIYLSQKSTTKSKKKKKARFILSGPRSLPMLTLSLSLFYNNIFPFVKA